jgi:hypothetical protein
VIWSRIGSTESATSVRSRSALSLPESVGDVPERSVSYVFGLNTKPLQEAGQFSVAAQSSEFSCRRQYAPMPLLRIGSGEPRVYKVVRRNRAKMNLDEMSDSHRRVSAVIAFLEAL